MCPCSHGDLPAECDEELVYSHQLLRGMDVEGNGSGVEGGSMTVPTLIAVPMGLIRGNVIRQIRKIAQSFNHAYREGSAVKCGSR